MAAGDFRQTRETGTAQARRSWLRWCGALTTGAAIATTARWTSAAKPMSAPHGAVDADMEMVLLFGTKDEKDEIPSGFGDLASPPWNAYNHYEILSTKSIPLT